MIFLFSNVKKIMPFFLIITTIFLYSCNQNIDRQDENKNDYTDQQTIARESIISIGSVSHAIQNEILLLQPFADFLSENLREFGIKKGRVVVTRNIEDMAILINSGEVDIYIDSPYPIFSVAELANLQPILKHLRDNTEYYKSVIFTKADSEINELKDLKGHMIAMEESYSTSGYFLPTSLLISNGIELAKFDVPDAVVPEDKVGYCFSDDDESTVFWVLNEKVKIGATDITSYYRNSGDRVTELKMITSSIELPRQLVAIRDGFDSTYVNKIKEILLEMDESESGQKALESFYSTTKFEDLTENELSKIEKVFDEYFDSKNCNDK